MLYKPTKLTVAWLALAVALGITAGWFLPGWFGLKLEAAAKPSAATYLNLAQSAAEQILTQQQATLAAQLQSQGSLLNRLDTVEFSYQDQVTIASMLTMARFAADDPHWLQLTVTAQAGPLQRRFETTLQVMQNQLVPIGFRTSWR